MLSDDSTIVYLDIVSPNNSGEFDRENGIIYFFHTSENGHLLYPHIHAQYAGDEICIYLKDYRIIGKFESRTKQKEAIEYVKKHRKAVSREWNRIMMSQGGPKWED